MSKDPVIVIGYRGNMGKRYTAILDYLGHPWFGIEDMGVHYDRQMDEYVSGLHAIKYHSVLICTPTASHMNIIKRYKTLNLPMLCEKPVSFDMDELTYLKNSQVNIAMVNQYKNLGGKGGATYYNFYNSGKDGIEWDCINIVGLASQEKAYLSNESPIWECSINGKKLELNDVNQGYVDMIKDWLKKPEGNVDYIVESHKRVLEGFYEKGTYRNTSKNNKHEASRQDSDDAAREENGTAESSGELPKKRGVRKRQK